MEEEVSTSAELYRRLEKVRENRVAVQISYHVQETHSCHRNRLVNQMRELDHRKPKVKEDQILVQLELDQHQHSLQILTVLNRDLDLDQLVMVKLHQDLKVVQILRLNRNNQDQGQAT